MTDAQRPRTDPVLDELSAVGDEHADLAGRAYLRIKVLEAALAAPAGLRAQAQRVLDQGDQAHPIDQAWANEIVAALEAAPSSGTICKCGLAKDYHRRPYQPANFDGHEYAPRYLASPETPEAGIDVERLAEAWGNVMDGRRIKSPTYGHGFVEARIAHDTTTAEDWRSIAAEYARLVSREEGER